MPRATPKKPLRKCVERRCGACHAVFDTTRPKATRCPQCISQRRKVRYRSCVECTSLFVLFDEAHLNCAPCAAMLGLDQHELSAEQIERLREEERLANFTQARDRQLEWLTRRDVARSTQPDNRNHQYDLASLGLI